MQTFLPYADFPGSAKVLDRKRLDIQRDGRIIPPLKCGEDTNMLFVSMVFVSVVNGLIADITTIVCRN